jgi:hypothetical protein
MGMGQMKVVTASKSPFPMIGVNKTQPPRRVSIKDITRNARTHKLRIPDSLTIAGFNGDYAFLDARQRLTTMKIPSYEMGRKAAEMAFNGSMAGPMPDCRFPSDIDPLSDDLIFFPTP